jgi:hypothetical protein
LLQLTAAKYNRGSYTGDWGDYISFAQHLRDRADAEGVDLLLIDTGDRIEGNGLYDGSKPRGLYTFEIFGQQHMDVICSGNHELYKANSSNDEYLKLSRHYNESYIASNLDIIDQETGEIRPLAPRYRKFTTKNQGIRVLAMGWLFNFERPSKNTIVTRVEDAVKEAWFHAAIRDKDVDLFLIAGHVTLRSQEYDVIFRAIRKERWDTPIQFFGGHFHIRDWRRFDSKSYGLASGRYLETLGFSSIDGLKVGKKHGGSTVRNPTFKRRYIDNNLYSLYHHSGKNASNFDTKLGANVTKEITVARQSLKLDSLHGCAPQDYFLDRADIQSNQSIFSWLTKDVLPTQLAQGTKASRPKLILQNTGALRFDVFEGMFTKDTTFLISPFTSGFRQIKDVDSAKADKLVEVLNGFGPIAGAMKSAARMSSLAAPEQLAIEAGLLPTCASESETVPDQSPLISKKPKLTPGYTTKDDDGDDGDDIVHDAIVRYKLPQVISTLADAPEGERAETPKVDVLFDAFIEPWVIQALQFLGATYQLNDTSTYMEGWSLTTLIANWVENNWPCPESL